MDFPITEYEMPSRHISAQNPAGARSDSFAGSFADLLSADRFSDVPEGPMLDEVYDELDALASRDDGADEDSAYDDTDADRDSDSGTDDNGADDDREKTDEDGARADSDPDSIRAGIQLAPDSGGTLIGDDTTEAAGPSAAQSTAAQAGANTPGATRPQDQFAAALAGNTAVGSANPAETRVMNRRSNALQANAQHAATVKSQLAKAESAGAEATARTPDAGRTDGAKTMLTPHEATQPKTEAGRLDQAFRAAFPQNANTPAVTPTATANQSPLTTQAALITDGLTSTSAGASSGDGGDTSTQIQQNAERANNVAASKAAATRSPFTLPGSRPAEQVSVQIQNAARNGTDRISIRLSPAALGKVEVKLELSPDKTVQAIVTAEKPETLDMLERDARTLQRALEEAGLRTNSDSLSFERRDTGGASDSASDSDGNETNGTDRSDRAEHDDDTGLVDVELSSRRHHDGLLDVEV